MTSRKVESRPVASSNLNDAHIYRDENLTDEEVIRYDKEATQQLNRNAFTGGERFVFEALTIVLESVKQKKVTESVRKSDV